MKVAYVAPYYSPARVYGGPAESMLRLGGALARHGCDVRVLTTDANGLDRVLDVDTTRELELEPRHSVRYCPRLFRHTVSPAFLRRLPEYARWCDVMHVASVYNFTTIPALAAAAAFGKPVVWSPQGALQRWEHSTRRLPKEVWEAVCKVAAPGRLALHVTSESEQEQSRARMPNAITALIPHGVFVPKTLLPKVPSGGVLRLLSLGRLHPIKGLENLLSALAERVGSAASKWSLVIAGTGEAAYEARLRELVVELGLGDRVRLVGHMGEPDKPGLFAEVDLFIAPSFTENFGLAIAEALAHAVPVIAGRGTPWSGLVPNGCGLWVDNDAASLRAAIQDASAMPLEAMGLRGRAWVEREFTRERAASAMLSLYEQLTRLPG